MFSTVLSASLHGLCVEFINVEADVSNGLPMFHLVGYLSSEVKEAGERVRTAIRNSDIFLPAKKIVVNLSPADKRKKGTAFDLPIAVSILLALELVPAESMEGTILVGELSLDGGVKRVAGVLPIVMAAKERGCKRCMVPEENLEEAALVEGIQVIGVEHLRETCAILKGERKPPIVKMRKVVRREKNNAGLDYADIKGQYLTKRAVEVAVAGNHSLLMVGPPGCGKTAIAKRIPTILPPLTQDECMELTKIYSVMGELDVSSPLVTERPFREVHQSITRSALLGGGAIPKPGEITLANKGVLFLDEIAEFQKPILELLRQPLEEHRVKIIREKGIYEFPADFLLVAAMNPCPCGNYPNLDKCNCTTAQIQSYLGKLSQPFLDRIDICVEAEKVPYDALNSEERAEDSETIRARVMGARIIQKERYAHWNIQTNSQLNLQQVDKICKLKEEDKRFMEQVFEKLGLTARTYHKVLCVARTIADLEGKESITGSHLREALSYRTINQKYWRK